MRTDSPCIATGTYRSGCPCRRTVEIARGAEAPRCPECDAPTDWTFSRSTYAPPRDADVQVPSTGSGA